MRRRVVVVVLVVVLVAAVAFLARHSAAETKAPQENLPHYSFIVTKIHKGFKLTCRENCAWEELAYSCTNEGCGAVVDEHGVRTALEDDWPK